MAIYSFSTTPISRTSGRSAVAAAAYRSGSELTDERTGVVHDYTRRAGVVHAEIVTRDGVPTPDREQLWNAAEAAERRKDARVAREYLVALPHELDADQRQALARELAGELSERYGVAVDMAIHAPDRDGDQRNYHAHLLATTRSYGHDGLGEKSAIEWSDKKRKAAGLDRGADEVKMLRQRWETLANAALERAQVAERVDCRSLADQGIDRVPQIHVGPMGTEQIRRGTPENSDRAMLNLEIVVSNQRLHQLQERAALRAAERDAIELADWEAHISQPGVCPSTGRIDVESRIAHDLERSYRESQRLEAAERAASRPVTPVEASKPEPTPYSAPLSARERALADVQALFDVNTQLERAAIIRDAMIDSDEQYADAFQDALVELKIGHFGELPAASSQERQEAPQRDAWSQERDHWPSRGNDGPELG